MGYGAQRFISKALVVSPLVSVTFVSQWTEVQGTGSKVQNEGWINALVCTCYVIPVAWLLFLPENHHHRPSDPRGLGPPRLGECWIAEGHTNHWPAAATSGDHQPFRFAPPGAA